MIMTIILVFVTYSDNACILSEQEEKKKANLGRKVTENKTKFKRENTK